MTKQYPFARNLWVQVRFLLGGWRPLFLLLSLAACAPTLSQLNHRAELKSEGNAFILEYGDGQERQKEQVEAALRRISSGLALWGGLKEPVRVAILQNHARLEEEANKSGYTWLRAWARYDEVLLQSPETWSLLGANGAALDELLLHELTHCVMYQQAASRTTWRRKEIPMWFREGMASYSANQGYRWPTLEDLADFYAHRPQVNPLLQPEALYQEDSNIVYSAGHHAFTFLVNRYGAERVRTLLKTLTNGDTFPPAFEEVFGISPAAFAIDFQHYVRWRAFR